MRQGIWVVAGRLLFLVVSALLVVAAGGGVGFLRRPVGVAYLALWTVWWIVTPLGRQRGVRSAYDREQRPVMALGVDALVVLVLLPPWEFAHLPGPLPREGTLSWTGLSLLTAGIALQSAAMWSLRRFYTTRLGVQPGHEIVTGGPYRLVRHPGYLSYVVSLAGIALALGSLAALTMTVLIVPVLVWRISREEQMLLAEFGDAYRRYALRTPHRLLPGLY